MVSKLNLSHLKDLKSNWILYFILIVSLVATSGSLYFSEVKGYLPCSLCWFQRIFMYPQVLLSGIALLRNDKGIIYSLLPVSVVGIIFSTIHLFVEASASHDSGFCDIGVSCAVKYINWFGCSAKRTIRSLVYHFFIDRSACSGTCRCSM